MSPLFGGGFSFRALVKKTFFTVVCATLARMTDPIVSTAHAEVFDYPEEDAYQDEPTLAGKGNNGKGTVPAFPSLERAAKQLHVLPEAEPIYGAHTYVGGPVRKPRQSVCPNCGLTGSLPCGCTEG